MDVLTVAAGGTRPNPVNDRAEVTASKRTSTLCISIAFRASTKAKMSLLGLRIAPDCKQEKLG